jgi:hypothetical protein
VSNYLQIMPSKSIELPPRVAKAFVRDMRAFFKAKDQLKRDARNIPIRDTINSDAPCDGGFVPPPSVS